MSATSAGRLLISHITLRGPELAQLYALINARPEITAEELRATLCPLGAGDIPFELADAPLREALSFLTLAGLVVGRGRPRRHQVSPLLADVPFRLLLLRHLSAHAEERQRAISLVHQALIVDDVLTVTPQAVRDRLERGPLRGLFAWTGEKVTLWAHLAAYIGLIRRPERSVELLMVPQPALLLDVLDWALIRLNGDTSIDRAVRLIDAELFACLTSRGRVHRGLVQALLALERLGRIRLGHSADAARSLLIGERRVSEIAVIEPVLPISPPLNGEA